MSSINNSYSSYSYDFNKVHKALDKDKNGYLTENEVKAYKQKLANKNTASAKKATHFLTGLLNNYASVKSLYDGALAPQGIPYNDAQLEEQKQIKQKEALGVSINDFARLANINATYSMNTLYSSGGVPTFNNYTFDNLQSKIDESNRKVLEYPPP
ncbi:MAG: hypothetical protein QE263_04485 [Vampirovibrionales bacterium]|nr:hypothetical protein [Vampirovibrionales bacterium]